MSRVKGTFIFSANFEPLLKAPLDARQIVGSYTDLVDPSAWKDSEGNVWLYNGATVVVTNDPSSGIYWLKDANNYQLYSSWVNAAPVSPIDTSAIAELKNYIDASLAERDASISYLFNWNLSQDASIIALRLVDSALEASINDLYILADGFVKEASLGPDFYWSGGKLYVDVSVIAEGVSKAYVDGSLAARDASIEYLFNWDYAKDASIIELRAADATLYDYIDATLALRDASIEYLYQWDYAKDASIEELRAADASIYDYIDATLGLYVKEASLGTSFVWDSSGYLDVSVGIVPSGAGIDGGVWITDIQPTSTGNVGDKSYSSDGNVLDSCLTDTSSLTVSVLALPGHTNYKPVVTIDGNPVTISETSDKTVFTGTYAMQYDYADASITAVHEDGAHWSTIVDADIPPVILSANFTGGYPGSQTELKAGDTFQVNIVTDISIDQVQVVNYGALQAGTFSVSGTNNTITGVIADRGTSQTFQGFQLRVRKPTGSVSTYHYSVMDGSVNGVNLVYLNNLYPTITIPSVLYPAGQGAIKSGEDASVNNTVTNFDTISYTNPLSQLTIANSTTYETVKKVTYLSGGYNISSSNFSITATRAANNATTGPTSTVVWIANTPATLSVSNPASRLRSGGNDGTSAQNHTITITASQRLLAAPTLAKDTGGTWLGTGFTWSASATSFTRSLQVHDNDLKAVYNWGAISGTNLAGIVTTTNIGATTYTLGGFVVRTIAVAAFGWQSNINVEVSDYSKLSSSGSGQVLAWSVSNMNTRSTLGDVTRPQASTWSASATFTNPTTINILDKSATDSASQASSFTIQEAV